MDASLPDGHMDPSVVLLEIRRDIPGNVRCLCIAVPVAVETSGSGMRRL